MQRACGISTPQIPRADGQRQGHRVIKNRRTNSTSLPTIHQSSAHVGCVPGWDGVGECTQQPDHQFGSIHWGWYHILVLFFFEN